MHAPMVSGLGHWFPLNITNIDQVVEFCRILFNRFAEADLLMRGIRQNDLHRGLGADFYNVVRCTNVYPKRLICGLCEARPDRRKNGYKHEHNERRMGQMFRCAPRVSHWHLTANPLPFAKKASTTSTYGRRKADRKTALHSPQSSHAGTGIRPGRVALESFRTYAFGEPGRAKVNVQEWALEIGQRPVCTFGGEQSHSSHRTR
jgi:hypothetical protein